LQEVNKESEHALDGKNKSEITMESARQSSQRMSIPRSISRGSSGAGNSSRNSFSVSFGLPTGVNGLDTAWTEKENPPLSTEKSPKVSLRRLAYINKPEIPVLIIGAIAAVISGVIFPIFGLLISSVIKTFFEPPHELKKDSGFWALIFMVLGLASFLAIPARTYFFSVAGCKLIQRIRVMCFEKVVRMEVGWFDEPEHSSGAIGARLSADAASVRALVGDALGLLVENAASAVAGVVIAFVASWQLALIVLALIPLIGVNGFLQVKFMKGFSEDAKVLSNTNTSTIHDSSMVNI
jgi:ATP-binding cassette subfamily B (MDR/TAP) protein 1